jgi:flagella basal body P-ring formation protein FlgA
MIRALVAVTAALLAVTIGYAPVSVCAQAATQRVNGKRIEHLAKPAADNVSLQGDAALVQAFTILDQIVPAGTLSLSVGTALVNPSYVNVPVEIDVDGKFLRQVFVGYRVQQYVKTAVAAHDLVPGTVLTADDVRMARVPFSGQRLNSAQVLIGRRVVGATRSGATIAIESTQTNQIVKAGNSVVLIVHDGGVSVVADVVARTSGGLGDEIQLYNPQTRKTLSGIVVGPDRVELDLSGDTQ